MEKNPIKPNIGLPRPDQKKIGPLMVVSLFLLIFFGVCFYNSRKVALWDSQEENGKDPIFNAAVLSYANTSETLKEQLKLDRFFQNENSIWKNLKESPLVFGQPEASEIVPSQEELPSGEEGELPLPVDEPETVAVTTTIPTATDTFSASTTVGIAATTTAPDSSEQLRRQTVFTPVSGNAVKKSGPFRMLIVGDSFVAVGGGMGDPLEKTMLAQKDTIVTRLGKVSSGLARQDYFNWPATAQKLVSQHNPNVAIMMYGANDNNPVIDPNGKVLATYGSAKWDDQYRMRIDQMLDLFTQAKCEIFVIGVPVMKSASLSAKIAHLDLLFKEEAAKYSNAHFISTWELLTDKNGNYTDYILDASGKKRLVRTADGVHLQYYAGYYVSDAVVSEMRKYLDLQPK